MAWGGIERHSQGEADLAVTGETQAGANGVLGAARVGQTQTNGVFGALGAGSVKSQVDGIGAVRSRGDSGDWTAAGTTAQGVLRVGMGA